MFARLGRLVTLCGGECSRPHQAYVTPTKHLRQTSALDATRGDRSHSNLHKKLSYHRGTARHAMLVNLCHVSRGMGARKFSNSKSDLQDHSRASAMVSFNRPHSIFY